MRNLDHNFQRLNTIMENVHDESPVRICPTRPEFWFKFNYLVTCSFKFATVKNMHDAKMWRCQCQKMLVTSYRFWWRDSAFQSEKLSVFHQLRVVDFKPDDILYSRTTMFETITPFPQFLLSILKILWTKNRSCELPLKQ